jgi:hypothetical protein
MGFVLVKVTLAQRACRIRLAQSGQRIEGGEIEVSRSDDQELQIDCRYYLEQHGAKANATREDADEASKVPRRKVRLGTR